MKAGVKIYPIPKSGTYYLAIEVKNERPKIGKERYDPKKTKWVDKIHELYEHFYSRL